MAQGAALTLCLITGGGYRQSDTTGLFPLSTVFSVSSGACIPGLLGHCLAGMGHIYWLMECHLSGTGLRSEQTPPPWMPETCRLSLRVDWPPLCWGGWGQTRRPAGGELCNPICCAEKPACLARANWKAASSKPRPRRALGLAGRGLLG